MSRATFFLVLTLSLLAKPNAGFCAGQAWPTMAEFTAKVGIETSAERIFFEFPLLDVQGQPRYSFICVGGSDEFLAQWQVNYVGPLSCRLVEGTKNPEEYEDTLLSEDDSAHWFSRGQIHDFHDLTGSCAKYPEYGALRHFRLRGFELTLTFGDVEVDKRGNPTYFTLTVSLRRDARTFVGTSANAVRIQIWTALIAILLLKILQFKSTFGWALSNLVALLRWNLFSYRDLWEWINRPFDTPPESPGIQGELFDLDSILRDKT